MQRALLGPLTLRNVGCPGSSIIPSVIWGPALSQENPTEMVYRNLALGHRGFETHPDTRVDQAAPTGEALRRGFLKLGLKREDIFVQSKLRYGPDMARNVSSLTRDENPPSIIRDRHPLTTDPGTRETWTEDKKLRRYFGHPENKSSPAREAKREAFDREVIHKTLSTLLEKLHGNYDRSSSSISYIDLLILHAPEQDPSTILKIWEVLEQYVPTRVRHLGIAHQPLSFLHFLYKAVSIKPAAVMGTVRKDTAYAVWERRFCRSHEATYLAILKSDEVDTFRDIVSPISHELGVSHSAVVYALMMELQEVVVNHRSTNLQTELKYLAKLKHFAQNNSNLWAEKVLQFKKRIKEENPLSNTQIRYKLAAAKGSYNGRYIFPRIRGDGRISSEEPETRMGMNTPDDKGSF